MDLEKITTRVVALCSHVAEYIREQSDCFSEADIEEKGRHNLVTFVDRTSEEMLVEGLSKILPGAGFLAEEDEYPISRDGYNWVIDPLDGTTNFIHGLPIYSISVGLMKQKAIEMGAVYHVPARECYHAWRNGGAYLNAKPIRVSQALRLESSLLVTGFPYQLEGKLDQYLQIFKELVETCRGVRRLGSAAIDLCYVAAGKMEGFYEYGLNTWDVAAGSLIVEEAGGRVTDFNGLDGFLFDRQLLATNGIVHEALREIIARHFLHASDFH